jgi:hypothetical protein
VGVTVEAYGVCVQTPDHSLPPTLDLYWSARLVGLKSDLFTCLQMLGQPHLAESIYECLDNSHVHHAADQERQDYDEY